MRKITLTSALVIMLVLPGLATAVTLDSLSGTADCNSWSADLTISFRMFAMMGRVEYTVILRDADGTEVERFEYGDFIAIPEAQSATFTYGGDWAATPDGTYTVSGEFFVYDVFGDGYNVTSDTFNAELACGSAVDDPDPGEICLNRSPFWAANPGQWPVDHLELGGRTVAQDQLLTILNMRNGRPLALMIRELIAAKLNLASGGSDDIMPVIAKADALLMRNPSGRRNIGRTFRQAMVLRQALFRYNRRGCPNGNRTGMTEALTGDFGEPAGKASVEIQTLGTIKAMYR